MYEIHKLASTFQSAALQTEIVLENVPVELQLKIRLIGRQKIKFTKGLQIVYDLNKRVYGKYQTVPDTFDPRKVLDDYKNPLTGI